MELALIEHAWTQHFLSIVLIAVALPIAFHGLISRAISGLVMELEYDLLRYFLVP